MPDSRQAHPSPLPEARLTEHVEQLAGRSAGCRAVHLHVSKLRPYNRRENHVRFAANTIESLLKPFGGEVFVLGNTDIFFFARGAAAADLERILDRLRYLFGDDPLLQEDAEAEARFYSWYDMERDHPAVLASTRNLLREATEQNAAQRARDRPPRRESSGMRRPIAAADLGRIEAALGSAEIAPFLRRQSICALVKDHPPEPVFKEIYVSIADLQRTLTPGIDVAANRWFFQHLTTLLDKRVLTHLQRNDDAALRSHYSLNLNVATLLSDAFLRFDGRLPAQARGTIVIELQPADVFADMGGFAFARDYLRERGYRLCIDGLSLLTFQFIDRERLGVDLLKIHWHRDFAAADHEAQRLATRDAIQRMGAPRAILCRCDNAIAVRCGAAMGISLFQGRHLDALLQHGADAGKQAPAAAC